ncbi:hypothetical protein [Haloarcula onubensis]|uniref:Uncharacterized protein n=1 Tax=Haloarcula onubensis TaxID=2950539 RepID=A0ABU2FTK8_9EURY|nr:hypothetical protein [Halomicroarcula sp. S3CR25-11]MDS0284099.1 hypothetical protein [Halomicroarcula sp. S3CR25-11]
MLQVPLTASPALWMLVLGLVVLCVPAVLGAIVLLRRRTDRQRRIEALERRVEELDD